MKFFIKIYIKLISNFWKLVFIKLMKSFIIHLVVNSNNNNILCYLNEESNHIVGMAIAALVVVASAAVAYLSTDSISSLTGTLNESFNDGFINENISLKDAREAILDY